MIWREHTSHRDKGRTTNDDGNDDDASVATKDLPEEIWEHIARFADTCDDAWAITAVCKIGLRVRNDVTVAVGILARSHPPECVMAMFMQSDKSTVASISLAFKYLNRVHSLDANATTIVGNCKMSLMGMVMRVDRPCNDVIALLTMLASYGADANVICQRQDNQHALKPLGYAFLRMPCESSTSVMAVTRALIELGADPASYMVARTSRHIMSPLGVALCMVDPNHLSRAPLAKDIVDLLVHIKGINLNTTCAMMDGEPMCPLLLASIYARADAVRILLDQHVDTSHNNDISRRVGAILDGWTVDTMVHNTRSNRAYRRSNICNFRAIQSMLGECSTASSSANAMDDMHKL